MSHKVISRHGREEPNANGLFVQNAHGATIAGPFADRFAAWAEVDRLDRAAPPALVDTETLPDGTQPVRLSFQIKVF